MNHIFRLASLLIVCGSAVSAQETAPENRTVAALVAGEPIYVDQVHERLRQLLSEDVDLNSLPPRVVAEMLEQFVRQRLVEEFLVRGTEGLSSRDLDAAEAEARKEQELLGNKFEDYLKQNGWTPQTFRKRLAWSLGWGRYLAAQMTDERLQKYFEAHRQRFDGTQIEASHILLKLAADASDEQRTDARVRAEQIRQLIVAEELTFADAAAKYSEAPSGASGGALGSFSLRQMPPALANVAFDLKPRKVSPPLTSRYGIHLVLVTKVTPGEGTWQESRKQLEPLVSKEVFQEVAANVRKDVRVEYKTALPHFSASGKLIAAE